MKLSKLSQPRDLLPRDEARHIFLQHSPRTIPEPWFEVVLDKPSDKPRALSVEEADRVRYLALFVKVRGAPLSNEELVNEFTRQFPSLQKRIGKARAQLLAAKFEPESLELVGSTIGNRVELSEELTNATAPDAAICTELDTFCRKLSEGDIGELIFSGYDHVFLKLSDDQFELFWGKVRDALHQRHDADEEKKYADDPTYYGVPVSVREHPEILAGGQPILNVFERLYLRLRTEGLEPAGAIPPARRWWAMRSAILLHAHRPEILGKEDVRLLRSLASFTLAQLRGKMRKVAKGDEAETDMCFSRRIHSYTLATETLLILDDMPFMLAQLIQLLRVSPVPLVGDDLAYWHRMRSGLMERVVINLVNAIHLMAKNLEKTDPKLRGAREELARFCLARIGQKKGEKCGEGLAAEESMVERNSYWRACYMHAVDSLRVNPDNKGHKALYWSMHHDPHAEVRELAKELYPRVERKREISDGSSPRRPLITAIWWMLQAHRLGLGLDVDDSAIQATLAAMMRRTTESLSPAKSAGSNENPETIN